MSIPTIIGTNVPNDTLRNNKNLNPKGSVELALTSCVLKLGECMALWGEPNEFSIQHRVYIFMKYVASYS